MQTTPDRPNHRRAIFMATLVICAAAGLVAWRRPAPPAPFLILQQPYRPPLTWRDRLDQWIPAGRGWTWAWRLEQTVLGRRKPVNLQFDVFSLTKSLPEGRSLLGLRAPTFEGTNGLRAWLLDPQELAALRETLGTVPGADRVSRPRLSTAHGVAGRIFIGTTLPFNGSTKEVGLALDCLPRTRPDGTDLFLSVEFSELASGAGAGADSATVGTMSAIRTNLDTAVRAQIPKGRSLLLLDQGTAAAKKRIGVVVEVSGK